MTGIVYDSGLMNASADNRDAPPPVRQTQVRPGKGCFWIIAAVFGAAFLFVLALTVAVFAFQAIASRATEMVAEGGIDEYPKLRERWSYGSGKTKAVRIQVEGIIVRETRSGFLSPQVDRIERILAQIRTAKNDPEVQALIVEIDSPGGAVSPSDELYHALMDFKASAEGRQVVAFTRDMAASGGYYVAAAADWIVAEPTAIVGSVGVILQALNWSVLSERWGITATTIKSGKNKDLLNPFQQVDPEDVEVWQEVIDDAYARFRGIVRESRGLDDEELETLADGRVLSAPDALDQRMIDEVGYWDDVVDRTAGRLGVESVRIVRYIQEPAFLEWFSQGSVDSRSAVREIVDLGRSPPKIMYLWSP